MMKGMNGLIMLSVLSASTTAEVLLVEEGKPKATLIVGAEASPQAREAAAELQSYLHRITGADLPVLEEAVNRPGARVLIGQAAAQEAAAQMELEIPSGLTHEINEEGYVVAAQDDTLILAGNETAPYEGTFFAVSDFLETLGCRWFFPTSFGEVVPQLDTVAVKPVRRVMRPEFRIRNVGYSGHLKVTAEEGQAYRLWQRRNRMNPSNLWQNPSDDSIWRLLPKEKYWDSHPHYYALKEDGSRNERFPCPSQPGVLEAAAQTISEEFREKGTFFFAFSPPDEPVLCHCPDCKRAMHGAFEGEGHGDVSDAYFPFVFALADRIREEFSDRWVASMAYYNRCRPPEGIEGQRDNLLMMLASIQQCGLHSYEQKKCWSRQEFRAMMERWSELTAGLVFYEYDPHDWRHLQRPVWRSKGIAEDLRLLKQSGGWGFRNEGQMAWLSTGLNYYVRAQLAWNLKLDPEDLVADFCQRFFGPAATPMHRYYTAVERAIRGAQTHFAGYPGATADAVFTVLPRELLDRCAPRLEEAQELAVTAPFQGRVAAFQGHFDRIDAAEKARADTARGDFPRAVQWGEAMLDAVDRINDSMLLQDAGPWGGALSGAQTTENARELVSWTDGAQGRLVAVLPSTASFRTDPAAEGVVYRWYLPETKTRNWRNLEMTSGWDTQGVLTDEGRPYDGVAWYRVELDLPQRPRGPVRLFIPELKGSDVWVWVNGRFADHTTTPKRWVLKADPPAELTDLLQPGKNVLVFRVKGMGGFSLPPFLFTPTE